MGSSVRRPSLTLKSENLLGTIEGAFLAFSSNGREMDGKEFAKVCKDCNLFDKKFCPQDVDILFAKICEKGGPRKIKCKAFEEGLWLIAEKKCVEYGQVMEAVASSKGPVLRATQTDAVRLNDA